MEGIQTKFNTTEMRNTLNLADQWDGWQDDIRNPILNAVEPLRDTILSILKDNIGEAYERSKQPRSSASSYGNYVGSWMPWFGGSRVTQTSLFGSNTIDQSTHVTHVHHHESNKKTPKAENDSEEKKKKEEKKRASFWTIAMVGAIFAAVTGTFCYAFKRYQEDSSLSQDINEQEKNLNKQVREAKRENTTGINQHFISEANNYHKALWAETQVAKKLIDQRLTTDKLRLGVVFLLSITAGSFGYDKLIARSHKAYQAMVVSILLAAPAAVVSWFSQSSQKDMKRWKKVIEGNFNARRGQSNTAPTHFYLSESIKEQQQKATQPQPFQHPFPTPWTSQQQAYQPTQYPPWPHPGPSLYPPQQQRR